MPFVTAKLNKFVFDEPLTPEAKYWIGFLHSDGCIHIKKGKYKEYPCIILGLKSSDGVHVQKFADFVGTQAIPHRRDFETNFGFSSMTTVTFWGQELIPKLAKYGVVPRKTFIDSHVEQTLRLDPDFWRGVIDGDGTVSWVKNGGHLYPAIALGGVRSVLEDFADFVLLHTGLRPTIGACRSIFKTGINCSKAKRLAEILYYPGCVALERKLRIAESFRDWTTKYPKKGEPLT